MLVRCPVCGDALETDEELRAHEHDLHESLAGGGGFRCPTCGEAFAQEGELVAHEATAHAGVDRPGSASGER